MKLTLFSFILLILFSLKLFAGRPVNHQITREQLIEQSNFIFSAWPSQQPAINKCSTQIGKWQVHKVYKGDRSLEEKIIAIAPANYKLIEATTSNPNSKGASFAQSNYKNGEISFEQSSSFLFTKKNADGCIELTANGAQEHRFKEIEMDALLSDDCSKSTRAIENILTNLPTNCEQDSDCKEIALNPDRCKEKLIVNIHAENSLDENWPSIRNTFFKNCQQLINDSGVCTPSSPKSIWCKNKKCIAGYSPEKISSLKKFDSAVMIPSCAPNDASAISIQLTNSQKPFPFLGINWWRSDRPYFKAGKHELHEKTDNGFFEGLTSSICFSQGNCKRLKQIDLKIEMKDSKSGTIQFQFKTLDDENFEGSLPLNTDNTRREICG